MLFNSFEFLVFLPLVFALYWILNSKRLTLQNTLIVFASYLFYGWWDWRFLALILFSTVIDYTIGLALDKYNKHLTRKVLLWASVAVNIGLLGVFKYFNFFAENLSSLFYALGFELDYVTLNILLPVGISFYTFQTLSYTIDVYRGKLQPTSNFLAFAAYVSFFPQLVAGPIERAANLLPQFLRRRTFRYKAGIDGIRQIIWGFFMKVVIADNCAGYVDDIFGGGTGLFREHFIDRSYFVYISNLR